MPFNTLPLLDPNPARDGHSGGDPGPTQEPIETPTIVAPLEGTIESGIEMGMKEVASRGTAIILVVKGIPLSIEPHDEFQPIFNRYKVLEFNAHAPNYERDFIQRNWAMYSVAAETLQRIGTSFPDPMRMLDLGCGTGFGFREAFRGREAGHYFGIDPSPEMLHGLKQESLKLPAIERTAREAKAGVLTIDSIRGEIIETLGGKPQIIGWLAAMHVVNKHEHLGPIVTATANLLDEHGRVVIGNYFHNSQADFEAFRERYMTTMRHQPTPPDQLFTPSQMEAVLRTNWLKIESCEEMVCTDGLRAYVMVAKHR